MPVISNSISDDCGNEYAEVAYAETVYGPGVCACENVYGSEVYAGTVYGPGTCFTAETLFLDIDTPARDLIEVKTSVEFIIDSVYLNPNNYVIVDSKTNQILRVREVLTPFDNPTSDRIMLVVDRHVAGTEYCITVMHLIQRNGDVLGHVSDFFTARDAKANSMLAALPNHFNTDPKHAVMRHVLQAISESDDRIGSL